jgi:hypothetical protein
VPMTGTSLPCVPPSLSALRGEAAAGALEVDAEGITTPAAQAQVYGLYGLYVQPVQDGLDIPDI